jgi:DNA topoisomerase I
MTTAVFSSAKRRGMHAGGLITYHRTDGVAIADERRQAIAKTLAAKYPDFLPEVPRIYKSKVKNAQEAHDAITVTDANVSPEEVAGSPTECKLYDLIWQATLACQMADAHFDIVCIRLTRVFRVSYGLAVNDSSQHLAEFQS